MVRISLFLPLPSTRLLCRPLPLAPWRAGHILYIHASYTQSIILTNCILYSIYCTRICIQV